ncbi:MAG: Hsp20/alpha crystallin family protein [bacterium]|jgi:HSP20 family protein
MVEKNVPTVQDNQVQSQEGTREQSRYVVPPVDIYEKDGELVVMVELPGADKDHIHVDVRDNILTIQAEPQSQPAQDALYKEFERVNFYRQFELSDKVDSDNISAEYKHGVMTLHLPRTPKAQPKKIEVKAL